MPGKRKYDSDSDVGRRLDYYSDSEDDRPKKKKVEKKVEKNPVEKKKVVNRIPPARRMEIIQKKQSGIDDPEFSCVQTAGGGWRVAKRKFPLDQTPKIEKSSPPGGDVHVTWMNMQQSVNDSLKGELAQLREKYDKLSGKYEEKKTKKGEKKMEKKVVKKAEKKKVEKKRPPPPPPPKVVEEYSYYSSDDEPPPPPPRKKNAGQPAWRRASPAAVIDRFPLKKWYRSYSKGPPSR
jgi:hypothetical protein